MRWWLRVRLAGWIGASLVLAAALTVAVEQTAVVLPNLVGGVSALPLAHMATLAPATLTGIGLSRGLPSEFVSVRPLWRCDTLLLALLALAAAGCAAAAYPLAGAVAVAVLRTTIGLAALAALCARALGARAAALAPTTAMVIACLFGAPTGAVAWWAFPIAPAGSITATAEVCALGILALALRRPSRLVLRGRLAPGE